MATLAEIREGIAARLNAMPNCQVSAYQLSNISPPSLEVVPDGTEYGRTFGGAPAAGSIDHWRLNVNGYISHNADIAAQKRLDKWMAPSGSESVRALIEGDRTLGGIAHDTRVVEVSGYQAVVADARGPLLMVVWSVEVIADHT